MVTVKRAREVAADMYAMPSRMAIQIAEALEIGDHEEAIYLLGQSSVYEPYRARDVFLRLTGRDR